MGSLPLSLGRILELATIHVGRSGQSPLQPLARTLRNSSLGPALNADVLQQEISGRSLSQFAAAPMTRDAMGRRVVGVAQGRPRDTRQFNIPAITSRGEIIFWPACSETRGLPSAANGERPVSEVK